MTVKDLRSVFKVLGVNYHRMTLCCGSQWLRAYAAEGLSPEDAEYDLCKILDEPFRPDVAETPGQAAARELGSTARNVTKEAPGEKAVRKLKAQAARVLLSAGYET